MTTPKSKGSAFEREISKKLSSWLFNDIHMLYRHPTSGAKKHTYVGDIVPQKQLPNPINTFPFLFELKTGYKAQLPNFLNYNIIEKWIDKAKRERTSEQHIIWLILRFKNYEPICVISEEITNQLHWEFCTYVCNEYFYIYRLNNLINTDPMPILQLMRRID
jgi:Holliday junction resolvase